MKVGYFDKLSPRVSGLNTRITGRNTVIGLGFILGLSLWFRTSNILLGPPIVASLLFCPRYPDSEAQAIGQPAILERLKTFWHERRLLLRKFLPLASGFVVSLMPLLASNLTISGNILFSNYPSQDRAAASSI